MAVRSAKKAAEKARRVASGKQDKRAGKQDKDKKPWLFQNGHIKYGGRKKGTGNKISMELREFIIAAGETVGFDGEGLGGMHGYLVRLAIMKPDVYANLLAKLIPNKTELTGVNGGAIDINSVSPSEEVFAKILAVATKSDPTGVARLREGFQRVVRGIDSGPALIDLRPEDGHSSPVSKRRANGNGHQA